MALVREFERAHMERLSLHEEVNAKLFVQDYDGQKLLQISTYGRSSRQDVGKLSQTIQLDLKASEALFQILKKEFGFK